MTSGRSSIAAASAAAPPSHRLEPLVAEGGRQQVGDVGLVIDHQHPAREAEARLVRRHPLLVLHVATMVPHLDVVLM